MTDRQTDRNYYNKKNRHNDTKTEINKNIAKLSFVLFQLSFCKSI